jgi:hypothetical protein
MEGNQTTQADPTRGTNSIGNIYTKRLLKTGSRRAPGMGSPRGFHTGSMETTTHYCY